MSATNRGSDYRENADYQTDPDDCRGIVRHCLGDILATPQIIMEPSVGDGNFITAIVEDAQRRGIRHRYAAMDINPAAKGLQLVRAMGGDVLAGDFTTTRMLVRPTFIVGNPPFAIPQPPIECPVCLGRKQTIHKRAVADAELVGASWVRVCVRCKGKGQWRPSPVPVAEKHIRQALSVLAPRGALAFILPLAIQETIERIEFWKAHGSRKGARIVYPLARRLSFIGGATDSSAYGLFRWENGYAGPFENAPIDHLAP